MIAIHPQHTWAFSIHLILAIRVYMSCYFTLALLTSQQCWMSPKQLCRPLRYCIFLSIILVPASSFLHWQVSSWWCRPLTFSPVSVTPPFPSSCSSFLPLSFPLHSTHTHSLSLLSKKSGTISSRWTSGYDFQRIILKCLWQHLWTRKLAWNLLTYLVMFLL